MKLYIYEHCPFCTRARMIFGLKSIPVELEVVMEGDAETPMRLIGKKAVPILALDDGRHMGESLDIVRYVETIGTPVLSGAIDARLDEWGRAAWKPALELFIPRFTRGNFAELATAEARQAFRAREEQAFGDLAALDRATPQLLNDMNARLRDLASLLEHRRLDYSMSDVTLWPLLRCLTIVDGLRFPPVVMEYLRRLESAAKVPLLFDQAQ